MTADHKNDQVRPWRFPAWAAVAWLAASLVGCGSSDRIASSTFFPVKGKLLLPDGKPLADTKLIFSGPVTSNAVTQSDGGFDVKGTKDGLPAGEYSVYLEGNAAMRSKKASLPFPAKYLDEDTSDLRVKVTPEGPNDFELKMTKGDAAAGTKAVPGRGPARVKD